MDGAGESCPPMVVSLAKGPIFGVLSDIPGSKSIANRVLVCAALADGTTELIGVPNGDDSEAFLECVAQLGAGVERAIGDPTRVILSGTAGRLSQSKEPLFTRLAGTTSRFVTALAALGPFTTIVDGGAPLRSRPMGPLHDALRDLGAEIVPGEAWGHLPVTVSRGRLSGGVIRMPGDISSQYVTALMLIAPYLDGGLRIELTSELVSRPYVEITCRVMADFGLPQVEVDDRVITIGEGRYHSRMYRIEPDASSASYPLAAAAICGGEVTIEGLGTTSVQGDAAFGDVLQQMGCVVTRTARSTTVRSVGTFRGVTVDMSDISDTAPTLAAIAAFAESPTRIVGIGFIRAKESDRIGDMVGELRRCGVNAHEESDGILIEPSTPHAAIFQTHHDHRLAMSLSLIGLRTPGIEIADPGVVSKSWPGFWTSLQRLVAAGE